MELRAVDPRKLKVNPNNPRRTKASPEADARLAANIREVGVLQPPLVKPAGKHLEIIYGERRTKCAIAAGVGWAVGYAWRNEVLPNSGWRVPAWMVGEKGTPGSASRSGDGGYEGLRRRLEGEASASGAEVDPAQDAGRRRTLGGLLAEQFGRS